MKDARIGAELTVCASLPNLPTDRESAERKNAMHRAWLSWGFGCNHRNQCPRRDAQIARASPAALNNNLYNISRCEAGHSRHVGDTLHANAQSAPQSHACDPWCPVARDIATHNECLGGSYDSGHTNMSKMLISKMQWNSSNISVSHWNIYTPSEYYWKYQAQDSRFGTFVHCWTKRSRWYNSHSRAIVFWLIPYTSISCNQTI